MSAPTPNANAGNPASTPKGKPTYISSSGNMLESPPLTARLSRLSDSIYNFIGLYFVSLLSLDPYGAAQNSQFNTVGRPNAFQERARWGGANRSAARPSGGFGGGSGGGGSGGSGGDGRGPGGGGGGRRMGTVDDVRGPECGSCG